MRSFPLRIRRQLLVNRGSSPTVMAFPLRYFDWCCFVTGIAGLVRSGCGYVVHAPGSGIDSASGAMHCGPSEPPPNCRSPLDDREEHLCPTARPKWPSAPPAGPQDLVRLLREGGAIGMARIRTIKPEAFISESLAKVSIAAERTFFGLLTQADDHGRFRDQAAVIAGALWSLRPEHGALEVEDDLNQLDTAELICRYEGDDGKRYLHIVTFSVHQKVNRPSGSRHPACPRHEGGRVPANSLPHGGLREGTMRVHAPLAEPSPNGTNPHRATYQQVRADSVIPPGARREVSGSPR